ncbi:DNA-binding protein [Geomonas sp. RF6]|uniref:DNA-binding protein n=1 Tax=Geomonas sp. RF6 TaxID=2897342 RepID=UPI001E639DEC|nr:DNA-binding protein [Geomonas sp. RF6]UFS71620.1 DNA-binding protein [Geomonas sp. RF6]
MKQAVKTIAILFALSLPLAAHAAVDEDAAKKEKTIQEIQNSMSKSHMGSMMSGGGTGATAAAGKVVETFEGGGYRYVNLENGKKKAWVAFPSATVAVGEELSFSGCSEMSNFTSKSLKRTFDKVLFCGGPEQKGKVKTAKAEAVKGKKSPGSAGAAAATEKVSVEKAAGPNAYTVAEVFAKSAALNGKKVQVRGKVVKVATGIMNRNWIHLQDGTGDAKKKTNDLVVTSKEQAEEGDVITISGTVAKDKDFGSGYKYAVIVEQATVKKQ